MPTLQKSNKLSNIPSKAEIDLLIEIENKVRWLASWTIHNANHIRPSRDGIKVGGHQASSASISTVMTALYMNVLRPEDKVAVKPHASPNFHAIQYLLGRQTQQQLEQFRAFGGVQSYPSITKDKTEVDFSTGSVGLGVAATLFSSITQDFAADHELLTNTDADNKGRMISILGDAELDEGNIYEALLEGWKKELKNTWWIIDFNRQSLDAVINDDLYQRILDFFESVGWEVVTLKYGKLQQKAFKGPAGKALKTWIDDCPNQLYSAMVFKGGAAWRTRLSEDLKGTKNLKQFLDNYNDEQLSDLMANLGGHDMELLCEAFHDVQDDKPRCFVAYTVKGYGLPLAGHKDNHAGMITPDQMTQFQADNNIADGQQWLPQAGLSCSEKELSEFFDAVPYNQRTAPKALLPVLAIDEFKTPTGDKSSTQVAFGKVMSQIAASKAEFANRVVTTAPDVASSTNLSAWVNKRGVYHRIIKEDTFKDEQIPSTLKWLQSPKGQHIELGIAESNLFSLLSSLGQAEKHFGERLLPIGTVYDPFICRGLDALNYACYQDARFMLIGTPAGITLAPEGGAHQSFNTQLIGMAQPNLLSFEPAYSDEVACIMHWSLDHMQKPEGCSTYLRLSTRGIEQPKRELTASLKDEIIQGGYWHKKPENNSTLAIVYIGVIAPEAKQAFEQLREEMPDAGLLAVTSADKLYADWQKAKTARQQGDKSAISPVEKLLGQLADNAGLVTVVDGYPTTLTWLGGVLGHRVEGLGVTSFGQSGDSIDLYQHYRIDANAILDACASSCLNSVRNR
jgi:pyruvate dehydrogenase E1 component